MRGLSAIDIRMPDFPAKYSPEPGDSHAIDRDHLAIDISMHRSLEVVPVFVSIGIVVSPNPIHLGTELEDAFDKVFERNRGFNVAEKDHGSRLHRCGIENLFDVIEMAVNVAEQPKAHDNLESQKATFSARASTNA